MNDIINGIRMYTPQEKELLICWTSGAGFIIKTTDCTLGIDLFLSDSVREGDTYKRLTLAPFMAEDVMLDYLIISHEHPDHLDYGSVKQLLHNEKTRVLAPSCVISELEKLGISKEQMIKIDRGARFQCEQFGLRAVKADHGELSPQAIGVLLSLQEKNVLFTGDTCYREDYRDMIQLQEKIDVLLVPINPAYGNPGPEGAAALARDVKADVAIPCHYWLFKEHGGDPGAFLEACGKLAPKTECKILAVGESFIYGN